MALPSWPDGVPTTARDGWQMSAMFLAPLATQMDGGNQRTRAQPGNNVASITYPLSPMTDAQYAIFETFMRTTLNNGASRWTMPVLTGTGTYLTKTVQFDSGKPPSADRSGGFVNVTLPLRILGM
jgi:hypothetical protein